MHNQRSKSGGGDCGGIVWKPLLWLGENTLEADLGRSRRPFIALACRRQLTYTARTQTKKNSTGQENTAVKRRVVDRRFRMRMLGLNDPPCLDDIVTTEGEGSHVGILALRVAGGG